MRPCIVLLACLVLGLAAPTAHAQAGPLIEQGDAAYDRFENREALTAYEAAYDLDSTRYDLLIRLARTHNDYAQDLQAQNDALAAESHFARAVRYAEALYRHYPDRAPTWFFRAATHGKMAQFRGGREKVRIGRAVQEYAEHALELDPDYALPYIALGVFYRELTHLNWIERMAAQTLFGGLPEGDLMESAAMLERAVALDDSLTSAHFELAQTYNDLDRRDEAILHLQRVLVLPPQNTADMRNRETAERMLQSWSR